MPCITRFAPSPTGHLHLGHAYSAWASWRRGDQFRLRLEDIDATRCRPEFATSIAEDLTWLGLHWHGEIRVQSAHMAEYAAALAQLRGQNLLYPCFCSRADILRAATAPHAAEILYPGTCRALSATERADRMAASPFAWRLDMAQAVAQAGPLQFFEERQGWITARPEILGDAVLARRDTPASYHLCVVHDDAAQNITHIIRGADLFEATHLHVLLQNLLGLPMPVYAHHQLLIGPDGKRLAKRDHAATLRSLRQAGTKPATILQNFEAE